MENKPDEPNEPEATIAKRQKAAFFIAGLSGIATVELVNYEIGRPYGVLAGSVLATFIYRSIKNAKSSS